MRSLLINTLTWILMACGAFLSVRGGLDYWESKSAQQTIASEWNHEQKADAVYPSAQRAMDESARLSTPRVGETTSRDAVSWASSRFAALPAPGSAIARLSIPRLDAVLYVVEGDDGGDLKRGPGHLIGTAMPGQDGNCVIAGHRDTHFRILKNIQKGDEILLSRHGQTFHYRVDEMSIVTPDNLSPLQPSRTPVLNLITCYPFYFVGSAPKRFVVHAQLENETLRASR